MRYAFWNNKGGVGKTFLCFASATEYACRHPGVNVVVVDMCPQANISEILLGGNGRGSEKIQDLMDRTPVARTIGGYYHQRILRPHAKTGTETDFLVQIREQNENAPRNMYLIAGDPSLELQVQTLNNIAVQDIPTDSWRNVHSWVRDLQDAAEQHLGECVFFMDCNPSFSSYTEQAVLAAERLIVPCTADGSSARAIHNVAQLVYGLGVPPEYRQASFRAKADLFAMSLPKLYLVPMNRATTYRGRPARAFATMFDTIRKTVAEQQEKMPESFSRNLDDDMFLAIPDTHTVAVVASWLGVPIRELSAQQYALGGQKTMVNRGPLERYQGAIRKLVALL